MSRPPTTRHLLPLLTLSLVAFVIVSPAHGARQVDLEFDELLYRSALVFQGVVTGVDITAGGEKAARTRVSFNVDRVLRGAVDRASLVFEVPEGLLPDGRLVETAETPRFALGERYVVFVRGGSWRLSPVLDWHQGVLRLTTVAGHRVAVTDTGRCIADMDRAHLGFGPRVAPRLQWPGFPTTTGVDPPDASAADACLPASVFIARLDARVAALGLLGPAAGGPAPDSVRFTPVDDVLSTPTTRPGSR